jgi:hypothetical protein
MGYLLLRQHMQCSIPKCSGLRTGTRGLANTTFFGPAICANTYARGPVLNANEPTRVYEGLANTAVGQHTVRTSKGWKINPPRVSSSSRPTVSKLNERFHRSLPADIQVYIKAYDSN